MSVSACSSTARTQRSRCVSHALSGLHHFGFEAMTSPLHRA